MITNPYETNFATNAEVANGNYAHILSFLLKAGGHQERIKERLRSSVGAFTEQEAAAIISDTCSAITAFKSQPDFIWGAGVLTFYLLCGHQYTKNSDDVEFYNKVDLGPRLGSKDWVAMVRDDGRQFPSRKWEDLSELARTFISELTSHRPADRPCPLEASNHAWVVSTLDFEFTQDPPTQQENEERVAPLDHAKHSIEQDPFGTIFVKQAIQFDAKTFSAVMGAAGNAAQRTIKTQLGIDGSRRPLGWNDQRYLEEETAVQIANTILCSKQPSQTFLWATGVTIYFMLCGFPPMNHLDEIEFYKRTEFGPAFGSYLWTNLWNFRRRQWKELSKAAREFVLYLTTDEHPSAAIAANHHWILSNLDIDWDDPFEDKTTSGGDPASEVVVRQHVRRRPNTKVPDKSQRKKQKQSPRRVTMDVDTLRALASIEKTELAKCKERNAKHPDPTKLRSIEEWKNTMANLQKQSRTSKGLLRAARTKDEREEKARKKQELDEWCDLYDRVGMFGYLPETHDLYKDWKRFVSWEPPPEGAFLAR